MPKQPARGAQRLASDQQMATAQTLSIDFGPSDGAPRARRKRRRAHPHAHLDAGRLNQVHGGHSYTTLSGDEKMTLNFVSAGGGPASVDARPAEDDSSIELIYPQPPKQQESSGWQHVTESLTSDGRRQQQIMPAEDESGWTYSAPSDSDLSDAPPPEGDPISEDLFEPPVRVDSPPSLTLGSPLPVGNSSQLEFGRPLPADGDDDLGEQCEQNTYGAQLASSDRVFSVLVTGNAIFGGHSQSDRKAAEEPTVQTGSSPRRRVIDTVQQQLLAERPELLSHEERRRLLSGDSIDEAHSSESSIIDLRDTPTQHVETPRESDVDEVAEVQVVTVPIMQPASLVTPDPDYDTDLNRGYVFPRKRSRSKVPADKDGVQPDISALVETVQKPEVDNSDSGSQVEEAPEQNEVASAADLLNSSCGSALTSDSTLANTGADKEFNIDNQTDSDSGESANAESCESADSDSSESASAASYIDTSWLDDGAEEVALPDQTVREVCGSTTPEDHTLTSVVDLREPFASTAPVDLSTVAPLQTPPQELLDRVLDQAAKLAKYPALSSPAMNLALRFRVRPNQILLTDTLEESREVVIRLFEYFDCRKVLVAGPYLQIWEDQFRKTGYDVALLDEQEIECPGRAETTTKQRIVEQADPTVVVVSNPNRFTGQPYSTEALIDLAARYQLLVVDETLMPLAAERHCDSQLVRLPNVVVIRNIARPWHTPGLEGTCYVGPADLLSHPTVQAAAPECSDLMAAACDIYTSSEARAAQRETVAGMEALTQDLHFRLSALADTTTGFSVEPLGAMPFVLASLKDGYGHWQSLRDQGWMVRTCEDAAHLGPDWARICVHSEQVHTDFVSSLETQIQGSLDVAQLA